MRSLVLPLALATHLGAAAGVARAAAAQAHPAGHAHTSAHPAPHDAELARERARQLAAVRQATARYRDHAAAKADGFVRFGRDEGPLMGEHWYRKGAPEPPPGAPIALDRPGTLQYAVIGGRRVLVGVAYSVRLRPGDPLPDGFAGPEDHWHQHDVPKLVRAATEQRPVLRWLANAWLDGERRRTRDDRGLLTMVHAWVWLDNPDGVFADQHRVLPYLRAALPASWAEAAQGGDTDAARGVALLAADGCAQSLDGELWLAHADGRQRRALRRACADAALAVRRALPATRDTSSAAARTVNAAARDAWRALDARKHTLLTDRQRSRIAAVTEHPAMP